MSPSPSVLAVMLIALGSLCAPQGLRAQGSSGGSSSSTTTGGVNVIVGETTQPNRITLLRAGNYDYQTSGALTQVFEVAVRSVDVNIFSTGTSKGSPITVNIEPSLISKISGTSTVLATVTGSQIHVNPGSRNTTSASLTYNAGGLLNNPAMDIDFRFWFRGQTKNVSLDGSYIKVNLDGVRFGAPSVGGDLQMSGPFAAESIPQGIAQFSYQ